MLNGGSNHSECGTRQCRKDYSAISIVDEVCVHFLYLSVFVLQWSERDFGHPSLKRLLFEVGRSDRDFEITHGPIL